MAKNYTCESEETGGLRDQQRYEEEDSGSQILAEKPIRYRSHKSHVLSEDSDDTRDTLVTLVTMAVFHFLIQVILKFMVKNLLCT